MKIMLLLTCVLIFVTSASAEQPGRSRESVRPETDSGFSEKEAILFSAINRIRSEHGLSPLRKSDRLARIARAQSMDMAKSGVLSHTDRGGRDIEARIAAAGIKGWRMIGENVGRCFGRRDNTEVMVSIWMESEPHRRNILSRDFNQTGIGTATAWDGTLYATQVFMGSDDPLPGSSGNPSRKGKEEK